MSFLYIIILLNPKIYILQRDKIKVRGKTRRQRKYDNFKRTQDHF